MDIKMLKKITMMLCLLFVSVAKTMCQQVNVPSEFHDYQFPPQNLGLSTPQVSDFIKYGNIDIALYNGLLNKEIELDGYKDRDFEIPISLNYISNGFIPAKRPSIVGNNWMLNFGGVITRSVYGSPDDTKGNYNGGNEKTYIKDGILVAIRNGSFKKYSESDLTGFNMEKNKGGSNTPYTRGDFKYDFEPDVFKFSFGKHSGSFIIGNDGLPVSLCGAGYKIDISNLAVQEYSTSAVPVNSFITITTPDGYIYKFGGDITCTEYATFNTSNYNPGYRVTVRPRYITSWFLKSIKSPNNREVVFNYNSTLQKSKYNSFVYSYTSSFKRNMGGPACNVINPYSTSLTAENLIMEDNIYTPIIDKIVIDNTTEIDFDIKQTSGGFYETNDYSLYLSSITQKYNSTAVKKTSFYYLDSGNYFFLNSLVLNDQTYQFDYNLNTPLPNPMTTSLDHWGFWSGGNGVTFTNQPDIANYCVNIVNNRQVKTTVSDITLLNKITYPSGGFTEISYEYNRYNKYLARNMENGKLGINTLTESAPAGGARVKTVKDYDPVTQKYFNLRTFIYKNAQQTIESGIVGLIPKYRTTEICTLSQSQTNWNNGNSTFCIYWNEHTITDISANGYGTMDLLDEYHIAYSDVTEQIDGNGYSVYHFSSLNDVPDDENVTSKIEIVQSNFISTSLSGIATREKYGLYKTNDMSQFRGKLLTKLTYSAIGELQLTENYTYNIASAKDKYTISVRSVPKGCSSYKIFSTPCLLTQQDKTDKNGVQEQKKYAYNSYSQLASLTTLDSDSTIYDFSYTYPTSDRLSNRDFTIEEYNNIILLREKNIINEPFQIIKAAITPGTRGSIKRETVVESTKYDHINNNGRVLKHNLYKYQQIETSPESRPNTSNSYVKRITYHNYDGYKNPTFVTKDSLENSVYLWGYKGQYCIAEIKNATYAEVETAAKSVFSVASIDALSALTTPNETKLKDGSLQRALPNAKVTTYTYKPLVGRLTST
ncbi:MAG: hypothetical protein LBN93_02185, partial [Candidatus Symbiothrix sp.]|nr:hypothetical protein [Candidatus Symbiothrix sp.]